MREHEPEDRETYIVSGMPEAAVLFLLPGRGGTRHDWIRSGQVYRQLDESDLGREGHKDCLSLCLKDISARKNVRTAGLRTLARSRNECRK